MTTEKELTPEDVREATENAWTDATHLPESPEKEAVCEALGRATELLDKLVYKKVYEAPRYRARREGARLQELLAPLRGSASGDVQALIRELDADERRDDERLRRGRKSVLPAEEERTIRDPMPSSAPPAARRGDTEAEKLGRVMRLLGELAVELRGLHERWKDSDYAWRLVEHRAAQAAALWQLLDDIDTLGDSKRPEQSPYFAAVTSIHRKRLLYGASDGHRIRLRPLPEEEEGR